MLSRGDRLSGGATSAHDGLNGAGGTMGTRGERREPVEMPGAGVPRTRHGQRACDTLAGRDDRAPVGLGWCAVSRERLPASEGMLGQPLSEPDGLLPVDPVSDERQAVYAPCSMIEAGVPINANAGLCCYR